LPPQPLTEDELAACEQAILSQVAEDAIDPLAMLSDATHSDLTRLAETDTLALDNLEGRIQDALVRANAGRREAMRFSLKRYRDRARQLHNQRQEALGIQRALNKRNSKLKIIGGTDHEVRDAMTIADDEIRALSLSAASLHRANAILRQYRKGRIWYDTHYNDVFTDWDGTSNEAKIEPQRVTDAWMLECYHWLMTEDVKLASMPRGKAEEAVTLAAHRDQRHAPREWLESLKWDGKDRLTTWLSKTYGVDANDKYYADVGRCWIVSVVARIMKPGCKVDTMPVLIGPQGNRKSMSLQVLGGEWYATINVSVDKLENFLLSLQGVLIAEIAELDALRKADNTKIKTVLSTSEQIQGTVRATRPKLQANCGAGGHDE
jgi:hypothetical protein